MGTCESGAERLRMLRKKKSKEGLKADSSVRFATVGPEMKLTWKKM